MVIFPCWQVPRRPLKPHSTPLYTPKRSLSPCIRVPRMPGAYQCTQNICTRLSHSAEEYLENSKVKHQWLMPLYVQAIF